MKIFQEKPNYDHNSIMKKMKYDRAEREHIEFENWKKIVIGSGREAFALPAFYVYIDGLSSLFKRAY